MQGKNPLPGLALLYQFVLHATTCFPNVIPPPPKNPREPIPNSVCHIFCPFLTLLAHCPSVMGHHYEMESGEATIATG